MSDFNFGLLKKLCSIHAPSGNETAMHNFLLEYIQNEKGTWDVIPEVLSGGEFQNCIVLVFGEPRTAVYTHIDNIGFMARYGNELVKVGSPKAESGYRIKGFIDGVPLKCIIEKNEHEGMIKAVTAISIEPGTDFSYDSDFRESDDYIQSCYLDNRMGVFVTLQLLKSLRNGVVAFTCWEEHGGGSASHIAGYVWKRFGIRQALICDITWVTEGVHHNKGVVVSVRDSGIPRRSYVNRIREILKKHQVDFQLEVETSGGSDGNEIQKSPYPVDWCFVGAPEDLVHSPDEKIHKNDVMSMFKAYRILMQEL